MENLYDISKEIRILDSEINRYSFLLESDESTIDNYYLTGDSLFIEADDSNKRPSILASMINAIKRFITKCKAKFFKLIGSDKYKKYEKELSENKELANKEVKYNPRTKEFEILENDTKDINKILEKIKNGTATDEEILRLEEQVHKHKGLTMAGLAAGAGLAVYTLNKLFHEVRKKQDEKEKITEQDFQFIYQPSLLDPNKNVFSDDQIRQFQKTFALVKDNIEERNKLLLDARQKLDSIFDTEMKTLLNEHEKTSKDAKEYAEKQLTVGKKAKNKKEELVNKFKEREERNKDYQDNYETDHKDKSDEEKQKMAKELRTEIEGNRRYTNRSLKNRAAAVADHTIYRNDYKLQKADEKKHRDTMIKNIREENPEFSEKDLKKAYKKKKKEKNKTY